MKEFIEKLIDKIENEAFSVQLEKGIKEPSTLDAMMEKFSVFRIKEIVNQLAEEYKQNIDQDLMIVESLPSLYPLQPFEVEAIHKVASSAKHSGGWISVDDRLPELTEGTEYFKQSPCCLLTLKWWDGDMTESVGWYNQSGVWNEDSKNCKVVAWMPLPPKYQPNGY